MALNVASFLLPILFVAASPMVRSQDPAPGQGKNAIPTCEDMKKTPSGLEYGILSRGKGGQPPKRDDMVVVHYTGWLTDGTKFDSSRDRGTPATFPVNGVIKGWTEALGLMHVGDRFKLVIPPGLAYGDRKTGSIPPNSTLVFDVELLEIQRMPEFPARPEGDPVALESGASYFVITPGTGEVCSEKDGLAFRYAIWKAGQRSDADIAAGKEPVMDLLDCSERQRGHRIGGTRNTLPFDWMKELASHMKPGMKVRIDVPKKLFPNAGADTVWTLELEAVSKVPEFRTPDPEKAKTTDSGLVYEVIEQGSERSPKATDTVVAHYTGWLTDGTMFDSSHARGAPSEFALTGVIKGWTEGLQLMGVGGKYLFSIPGDLAYGPNGRGQIPPNATLVFLVELVDIK